MKIITIKIVDDVAFPAEEYPESAMLLYEGEKILVAETEEDEKILRGKIKNV